MMEFEIEYEEVKPPVKSVTFTFTLGEARELKHIVSLYRGGLARFIWMSLDDHGIKV